MSYLKLAQRVVEEFGKSRLQAESAAAVQASVVQVCEKSELSEKSLPNVTEEEWEKLLRWMESAEGLPAGSLRYYTQQELRQRFPDKKIIKPNIYHLKDTYVS
jgi:hypothetical protein